MRILLTFTGVHDPFASAFIGGEQQAGPVLTVASAQPFDCVHLLSIPDMAKMSVQTKEELQKRNPNLTVEIADATLEDPANHLGIPRQLKSLFRKISRKKPRAEYFICVSSGISHVDAGWLMLAASGEIHARILQARTEKFIRAGAGRVIEIDFTDPQSPQIKPCSTPPEAEGPYDFQSLCEELCVAGDHNPFLRELKTAFSMAEYDSPILLLGETGAGKEAFARLIHCASKRAARPFIAISCAAVPETHIESRLFGCLKEGLTGVDVDCRSGFEEADGGTLFLDELDALPAPCQAKLLRAMEYGKIQRQGDNRDSRVNVRVIAATRLDIKDVIADKTPRKNLYKWFYLLRFSAQTQKKWDRLLRPQAPALPEESPAQTNIVHLPSAAGG